MPQNPLLSLVNATAVWHAGLPPDCLASVRFLDALTLAIHRGDCAVIRHHDPAGAQMLLAALAGHPATFAPAHWTGERLAVHGLRVRRAAVRADVIPWILAGWHAAAATDGPERASPPRAVAEPAVPLAPVVHLLRASREGVLSSFEGRQWERWARAESRQGNAVVLVASSLPRSARPLGVSDHRPPAPPRASPSVREFRFRDGRLLP